MMPMDFSREVAALTPYLRGNAFELPGVDHRLLPGTRMLARCASRGTHDFDAIEDGGADAIVSLWGPLPVADWVEEVAQWRRVLAPGGTVALVAQRAADANGVRVLLDCLGGFECALRSVSADGGWLLTATRSAVAEVRAPLTALGSRLAARAAEDDVARAELYLQLGAILLQADDPDLARACFASLVALDPNSAQGILGLGMCDGAQGQWRQAQEMVAQAAKLDPHDQRVAQWRELAAQHVDERGGVPAATR